MWVGKKETILVALDFEVPKNEVERKIISRIFFVFVLGFLWFHSITNFFCLWNILIFTMVLSEVCDIEQIHGVQ